MLFLWDNDGRLHHRSDPSQRLKRAARSSYGFATLVIGCLSSPPFLPIGPADHEQGSVATSEKAGPARFPAAAAHVIAPVTDLRTHFRSIVPALPVRLDTQRDLSVSHLRVEIDVRLESQTAYWLW